MIMLVECLDPGHPNGTDATIVQTSIQVMTIIGFFAASSAGCTRGGPTEQKQGACRLHDATATSLSFAIESMLT